MPSDANESVEMEMIELLGMSAVDSPGLTGVEEGGEDNCAVDFQFGLEAHRQTISQSLPKGALAFTILLLTSVSMFTMQECTADIRHQWMLARSQL